MATAFKKRNEERKSRKPLLMEKAVQSGQPEKRLDEIINTTLGVSGKLPETPTGMDQLP
ncbi:hypothetical protein [uncultured Roseobacter sp.]|uniref:hypothetical protein n=1 Tax=uncultured Roseobacter sp. TaxID=114847 RepID=UPI002619C588|nr:hypothetical protein [uncultured Roseobacter sp.]